MATLTITDLPATKMLDGKRMRIVRGGLAFLPVLPFAMVSPGRQSIDSSIHASQQVMQMQSLTNMNSNGAAFLDHVDFRVRNNQNAQNNNQNNNQNNQNNNQPIIPPFTPTTTSPT